METHRHNTASDERMYEPITLANNLVHILLQATHPQPTLQSVALITDYMTVPYCSSTNIYVKVYPARHMIIGIRFIPGSKVSNGNNLDMEFEFY